MTKQPKLTKFGKIVIASVSFLLAFLLALLFYISLAYDKTSEYIVEARRELSRGNKENAYKIYFAIIGKDTSCEEAYRALAEISEERLNYKDAAYFWLMTSRLNPLDKDARRKYFEAVIISGADEILETRYETAADKSQFSDAEKFYIAKSYIRGGSQQKADALSKEIKSGAYKMLLSAETSLRGRERLAAEDKFGKALEAAKTENEKNNAFAGLAICALAGGDAEKSRLYAAKISPGDMLVSDERFSLEAAFAELDGDEAGAIKSMFGRAQTMRYKIMPLLDCVEAAFEAKDKATISRLKELNAAADKASTELFYYLRALESAVGEDWVQAERDIGFSGNFSKTPAGIVAKLEIAHNTGNAQLLKKSASDLVKIKSFISETQKEKAAALLSRALNKNKEDEFLTECILAIDPENPFANMLNMRAAFAKNDFSSALKSAKTVLAKLGHSAPAFNIACASALSLKDFSEAAAIAKGRLEAAPSDMRAALFLARALAAAEKAEEAFAVYKKIASLKDAPALMLAEAAGFFLANGKGEDFKSAILKIEKDPSKESALAALALKAEHARLKGDPEARAGFLREIIAANPLDENACWELAKHLQKSGEISKPIEIMRRLAESSGRPSSKFRLAVLLRDGSPEQTAESVKIFKSLAAEFPSESNVYLEYSKTLAKTSDKASALALARRAAEINANNSDAALHLGRLLLEQNLNEDAVLALERAYNAHGSEDAKNLLSEALYSLSRQAGIPIGRKIYALKKLQQIRPQDSAIENELKKLQEQPGK